MKNKKWLTIAAAVILAVTALPVTAFAEKKDNAKEKGLVEVTLNEVAEIPAMIFPPFYNSEYPIQSYFVFVVYALI